MRFYDSAEDLIDNELPIQARSKLFPIFSSGITAFDEIITSNKSLFESPFFSNLKGWLLSYIIYRQFEPDMVSEKFPFVANAQKVNNFNYKTLNLRHGNLILNVAKAIDKDQLPNRSYYRRKSCRLNEFRDKQLIYLVNKQNEFVLKTTPYYAFLTYGYKNNEINFLNILVPNAKMTEIIKRIDLKSEFALHISDEVEHKEVEKRIAVLKQDALLKIKNFVGEGNAK